MGKYITVSDVNNTAAVKTYLQSAGDTNMVDAIAVAEEFVEARLQQWYPLPLTSSLARSVLLRDVCIKIALYNLWMYVQGTIPDAVILGYNDALKILSTPSPLGVINKLETATVTSITAEIKRG